MIDFFLLGTGLVLVLVGILGCILPVIPGPPISYVGILLLHFTKWVDFSGSFLIIWLILVIAVTLLDYVVPVWGTKKFGGSKWGVWGSVFGLVIGLFYSPVGIFVGPFVGALIGELIYQNKKKPDQNQPMASNGQKFNKSLKAAFGSFIGLLFGILLKLMVSFALAFFFIKEIVVSVL